MNISIAQNDSGQPELAFDSIAMHADPDAAIAFLQDAAQLLQALALQIEQNVSEASATAGTD